MKKLTGLKPPTKANASKKPKEMEIFISPSKAHLATRCAKWQTIKHGGRLLVPPKTAQDGIDRHEDIEKDISIVKKYLPKNFNEMQIFQECRLEARFSHENLVIVFIGRPDCFIPDTKNKILYLYDWKTGGSEVRDQTEEQLITYAYAADKMFPSEIFKLVYVNPDFGTYYEKTFTKKELEDKVIDITQKIVAKRAESYNVGSHCKYCPAKSACPELLKQLKLLNSPEVNGEKIEDFTELQLDLIDIGPKVFDELKARLKAYLIFRPMENLHGYIIKDRGLERMIRQDADLTKLASLLKIPVENLFEKKLISVAQLEKAGYNVASIKDYIVQPKTQVIKKI